MKIVFINEFAAFKMQIMLKTWVILDFQGPWTSDYPLIDAWPYEGAIEFRNFSIRYRGNEKFAVKNATFSIKGGEKIAIVGRTGSGKTYLLT